MLPYLKDKKHYEHCYDWATVQHCLWTEQYYLNEHKKCPDKVEAKKKAAAMRLEWEIEKTLLTLDRYNQREDRIEQMMLADKRRDEIVAAAIPPSSVTCDICSQTMEEFDRYLMYIDRKEQVLFYMRCSEHIRAYKAVFQDGTEYKSKRSVCPKCQSPIVKKTLSSNQYVVKTKYNCSNCDYEDIDSFSSYTSKEDRGPDINFIINRQRFCLSGQLLLDTQEAALLIGNRKTLFDDLDSE